MEHLVNRISMNNVIIEKTIVFLLIIQICILQALCHTIDIQDTKVFEIALDDMNYDEENENEMIQPMDLADLKLLTADEGRYKPLHSHVKYYNERNAENKKQFPNVFSYSQPHAEETFNLEQEDKPFIAGFKHELDIYFSKTTKRMITDYITLIKTNHISDENKKSSQNLERSRNCKNSTNSTNITDENIKSVRVKREEKHYSTTLDEVTNFFQVTRDRNVIISKTLLHSETTEYFRETQVTLMQYNMYEYDEEITSEDTKNILDKLLTLETSNFTNTENPDEESYDYEKFKMEYEQQVEYNIRYGKALNYSEKKELEDTSKTALEIIINLKRPKNCTIEEQGRIGIKTIECLIYGYQHNDVVIVKKALSRMWLVLRVWLLIYICLAVFCWCQRGWCCCCFRCKFCFPQKRILFVKQYYTMNPPGTFLKDLNKKTMKEPIKYEATEYEYDAYKTFGAAIRNI